MRVAVFILALPLAGCLATASPAYHHWYKAGNNPQAMNADWYDCVRENYNEAMAVQCMKARGYQLAWSDDSPDDGLPAKPAAR